MDNVKKLIVRCDDDTTVFDAILAKLSIPEEDTIALQYLHSRHTSYIDLGEGLGYGVAYLTLDDLFLGIRHEDSQVYQRRYERALGTPYQEVSSRVQLKLVRDTAFQERVFGIYQNQIWPILQQDIA